MMIADNTHRRGYHQQVRSNRTARSAPSRLLRLDVRKAKKLLTTVALSWTLACWLMLALTENEPSIPNAQQAVTPPVANASAAQSGLEPSEQK